MAGLKAECPGGKSHTDYGHLGGAGGREEQTKARSEPLDSQHALSDPDDDAAPGLYGVLFFEAQTDKRTETGSTHLAAHLAHSQALKGGPFERHVVAEDLGEGDSAHKGVRITRRKGPLSAEIVVFYVDFGGASAAQDGGVGGLDGAKAFPLDRKTGADGESTGDSAKTVWKKFSPVARTVRRRHFAAIPTERPS